MRKGKTNAIIFKRIRVEMTEKWRNNSKFKLPNKQLSCIDFSSENIHQSIKEISKMNL